MRISTSFVVFVSLLAGMTPHIPAIAGDYLPPRSQDSQQQAAIEGLKGLQEITQEPSFAQTFESYGFDSPPKASDLGLGRALPIHSVRLDSLRKFGPADDIEKLLDPAYAVMYPITVQEIVRTSMTVTLSQTTKKWTAVNWGGANLVRRLTQLNEYKRSTSSFVVWIPGLRLYFLGDRVAGRLMLTPLGDLPIFQLKAAETRPADEVFLKLVPAAKARDDKPG